MKLIKLSILLVSTFYLNYSKSEEVFYQPEISLNAAPYRFLDSIIFNFNYSYKSSPPSRFNVMVSKNCRTNSFYTLGQIDKNNSIYPPGFITKIEKTDGLDKFSIYCKKNLQPLDFKIPFGVVSDKSYMLLFPKTVKKEKEKLSFWIEEKYYITTPIKDNQTGKHLFYPDGSAMLEYLTDDSEGYSKTYYSVNCKEKKLAIKESFKFDKSDRSKGVTNTVETSYFNVVPESTGESIVESICTVF